MLARYCRSHGDSSQRVTQTIQTEDDEETKPDPQQRIEDGLYAYSIDDVDKKAETEEKGESL
jgi:hypothetical protein